ncbi:hypothetical protein ADMFC3_00510 [Geovibrio sp. ADMFC3]
MKKTRVTIRFHESEAAILAELAGKNGMNISEFLRQLVRNELGKIKGDDHAGKLEKIDRELSEIKSLIGSGGKDKNGSAETDTIIRGLVAVRKQLQKENDAIMTALGLAFPHLMRSFEGELTEKRETGARG